MKAYDALAELSKESFFRFEKDLTEHRRLQGGGGGEKQQKEQSEAYPPEYKPAYPTAKTHLSMLRAVQ